MNQEGYWLSILEYSNFKGVSISSIRRYIKAGRVKSKKDDGKYFIFVPKEKYIPQSEQIEKENLRLKLELDHLERENKTLKEELEDCKMLISVYEGHKANKNGPPELPQFR